MALCYNALKNTHRGDDMGVSYKKLWKMLIDRDMIKRDLMQACGLSTRSMSKLAKGENIGTDILVRICETLDCDISDICEIVRDKGEKE